jgi:hypothetical protein
MKKISLCVLGETLLLFHGLSRSMRPDPSADFGASLVLSQFEFVVCLQIHPKLGRGPKVARQPKGSVRSDGALAADDIVDTGYRNQQLDSEPVGGEAKRFQELFA